MRAIIEAIDRQEVLLENMIFRNVISVMEDILQEDLSNYDRKRLGDAISRAIREFSDRAAHLSAEGQEASSQPDLGSDPGEPF